MTAPDRICAWPSLVAKWLCGAWSQTRFQDDAVEYIRRNPAVLAADPMVQALIGAVVEEAAETLDARASQLWDEMAGIWTGSANFKRMEQRRFECLIRRDEIRALRPDASAALQRMLRDAAMDELRAIEAAWQEDTAMASALIAIRNRIGLKEPTE